MRIVTGLRSVGLYTGALRPLENGFRLVGIVTGALVPIENSLRDLSGGFRLGSNRLNGLLK